MKKIVIEQKTYVVIEKITLDDVNYNLCYDENCDDYIFKEVDGIFQEIDSVEELAKVNKLFQDQIMNKE